MLSNDARLQMLTPPTGPVSAVIDTDTFNEVDDQFALVHALLSPEKLKVEAIYAAPFHNKRSSGPGDGMEKSYQEILEILELVHVEHEPPVYRGSAAFLSSETAAVESDAAHDLISRGQAATKPLYVIALGALTNIASALLLEPSLAERLVVVWLGGHAFHWPHNQEFNLKQERAATRVLLASGVPLVLIPCMGVTSHLQTTVPEIERYVEPRGEVGQFLAERFKSYESGHEGWSKEIWDLAPVAYLLNETWVPTTLVPTPGLNDDLTWKHGTGSTTMRIATFVDRDAIFRDLFRKLAQQT